MYKHPLGSVFKTGRTNSLSTTLPANSQWPGLVGSLPTLSTGPETRMVHWDVDRTSGGRTNTVRHRDPLHPPPNGTLGRIPSWKGLTRDEGSMGEER